MWSYLIQTWQVILFYSYFHSIGLRWCTEKDIKEGKGSEICSNKPCQN